MDIELAYLTIDVADVDGVGSVLTDVVGLMPGEDIGDAKTWRNDDRVHRIILQPGGSDDIAAIAFEAAGPTDLVSIAERLRSIGFDTHEGTPDECAERKVEALYRVIPPWGVPVELVSGLAAASSPLDVPLVPSGFLTEGVGLGHCLLYVEDLTEAHRFTTEGLGLRQTDSLGLAMGQGMQVDGRFYHCNPRHHTMALIQLPWPARAALSHVMVEVNELDDMGRAFDRAFAAGIPIASGIGRHPNDRMVSFYLVTPAGFQVEVGYGGRTVGADWSEDVRYDRVSEWGHQPVVRG